MDYVVSTNTHAGMSKIVGETHTDDPTDQFHPLSLAKRIREAGVEGLLISGTSDALSSPDGATQLAEAAGWGLEWLETGHAMPLEEPNAWRKIAVGYLDAGDAPRPSTAEDASQRGPNAEGAAQASASWGTWRVREPTNATARARHILVDSEEKALAMLKQLAFGAELGQLAAEHSLCPSKDAGGDLGVFKPGDMAEEFDAFVFTETSPVGTPLGPFATPFGYHVVIIDEREL